MAIASVLVDLRHREAHVDEHPVAGADAAVLVEQADVHVALHTGHIDAARAGWARRRLRLSGRGWPGTRGSPSYLTGLCVLPLCTYPVQQSDESERGGHGLRGDRALAHDLVLAVALVERQVDDRGRRRPAAHRRRSRGPRPRGWARPRPRAGAASAPAGAVGARLEHRPASGPVEAGTRRPRRSGSGPHASGKRRAGFGTSSVTGPGSRRRSADARALAQLGQRCERQVEIEEHHRRGPVGGRPFSSYRRATPPPTRGRWPGRRRCPRGKRPRRRPRCSDRRPRPRPGVMAPGRS